MIMRPRVVKLIALAAILCFVTFSAHPAEDGWESVLVADAKELFMYNESGNYFIQLLPSEAKVGHAVIMDLLNSDMRKDNEKEEDHFIASAYVHKFTYNKCDFTAFDIYQSSKNHELYSVAKYAPTCCLRHAQQGFLEFGE